MKRIGILSMLLSISIVVSILESFIPMIVPGVKIGFANIIILITLYKFNIKDAILLLILRILLVSLLLGTFLTPTFLMSLSGGILSLSVMILLKKIDKFNIVTVSSIGALFHSVGQIIIACILLTPYSIYYFPLIGILSIIAGIFTGIIGKRALSILKEL